MKKLSILLLAGIILHSSNASACTIAVISGRHTPDGRPILWKHRDTGTLNNKLVYFNEGKYPAIGLINSNDDSSKEVWIGFNSAGFAIMNSASYNLKAADDTTSLADMEGVVMKAALMSCATVDEFEQFLKDYPKPIGIEANFGVIDASGGAAYFETNNFTWTKIDVNDKKVAPHGYIVRTNYSFTGEANAGMGYIRFETAEKLFYRASATNNLSIPYMLENMCLSLDNSYSGQRVQDFLHLNENQENFIYYQDCINRYSSAASVIVQGVKQGEPVEFTTMWAMVGFPLASVPVPVWLTPSGSLPEIVSADGSKNSDICDMALELKKVMVPSRRGSTRYYINTTKVFNAQGSGITQKLIPVHREVYRKTIETMELWRSAGRLDQGEADRFYGWSDEYVRKAYRDLFGLKP
ncbi:MAG: hypothetical protein R6W67_11360 [Bacteroidales bacterium]